MKSIVYRVFKRKQFLAIIIFCFLIGLICLWSKQLIDHYPQDSYAFFPTSVYSLQMLVTNDTSLTLFKFFFPLIACVGVGDLISEDIKTNYIKSVVSHTGFNKYLRRNMVVSFILGGLVAIVPVVVDFITLLLFVPHTPLNQYYSMFLVSNGEFMPGLYYQHPFIYLLVRLLFIIILGAALSVLTTSLAYLFKNRYIAIAAPWFIFLALEMTLSLLSSGRATISAQFIGTEPLQLSGIIFVILCLLIGLFTAIYSTRQHDI